MRLPQSAHTRSHRLEIAAHPVAWAVAWLCVTCLPAWAQTGLTPGAEPGFKLKSSRQLQENFTPEQRKGMPTYVLGNSITGRPELETVIEGNAELRRNGVVLRADRIEYYQPDDLAKVRGKVYLNRDGNVYEGSEGQLRVDAQEGYFLQPRFRLLRNNGRGQASRIDFIDDQRSVARDAKYSVWHKEPGIEDSTDWQIKGSQVRIDNETNVGEASGARLEFMGVPILGAPYLSFPLTDERKSGWLPPSINLDNVSGLEVVVPYYLNLAANRDVTLYPAILSRRGINLGTEFRYLERNYSGSARLDTMPSDRLRNRNRWGLSTSHAGMIDTGLPAVGSIGVNLGLNRVSDDDYWRDFPRATSSLTQRLLANDASASWSRGAWSLYSRALKWQTLQQTTSVITPPYDRLPQLNGRYSRVNHGGLDYSLELDTTRFRSASALTLQPNAQRNYSLAQISRPFTTPGSFFIPKLQLHNTAYNFDAPLTAGPLTGARSASRMVPTFSLDSGLIFERNASYFGRSFTQTLEPRAFYTYTPFRDQSSLPVYDSGANDFNFATIFSENAFNGHDRLSDNNLLTLGVASRLLDPATGAEIIRLNYAQRLRFADQRVTLPGGLADKSRFSDMLFGGTINWNPRWQFDGTVQYNPDIRRSQRSTLSTRYTPSPYRVLSATYRLNRGVSEQIDLGWQWPINDLWGDKGKAMPSGQGQGKGRWYTVGRLNYSLKENRQVDTILGFEYDGGSWLGRVAVERLQTTTSTATKRILFQMEFVGFARVGSSPLSTLQTNVPRYQLLREKIENSPSRFSNYE
ncbi:LPS assembly protein LptD [Variovorax sp. PCZ-1]|uniref:LPS-assembly protein LptD n=1 Tax=Variovorax sp. PCZ-1 TaxID=2835533 RepID=UPI001BD0A9B8|nr:LPS assembly protein LptD [Variovorax sp. PCZ-1]MBS7806132.1 LPS-assembly protein LptD [Variovorax sp. PCZ-1]